VVNKRLTLPPWWLNVMDVNGKGGPKRRVSLGRQPEPTRLKPLHMFPSSFAIVLCRIPRAPVKKCSCTEHKGVERTFACHNGADRRFGSRSVPPLGPMISEPSSPRYWPSAPVGNYRRRPRQLVKRQKPKPPETLRSSQGKTRQNFPSHVSLESASNAPVLHKPYCLTGSPWPSWPLTGSRWKCPMLFPGIHFGAERRMFRSGTLSLR
jgi:hypothetical protein